MKENTERDELLHGSDFSVTHKSETKDKLNEYPHNKQITNKIIMKIIPESLGIDKFQLSSSSQKLIIITNQQASHLPNYPSFSYHPSILVTN